MKDFSTREGTASISDPGTNIPMPNCMIKKGKETSMKLKLEIKLKQQTEGNIFRL